MRLLVTRPEEDTARLRAHLIAQGHEVLVEPLLKISFEPPDDLDLAEAQALIATSANAVRALSRSPSLDVAQALPLFAVGPGTTEAAQALGFQNVITGPRDAEALIALIALKADVNGGPLVYLASNVTATDLAGELRRLGFTVQEPVVYTSRVATHFSDPIVRRFERGQIDGVLLFSPRTARTYARLLDAHGLAGRTGAVRHFCLSEAVARGLDRVNAAQIAVAAAPNLQEMLALLARDAAQSR